MKIEELSDHLNNIGIINIETVKIFLGIYTNWKKDYIKFNKSLSNLNMDALFTYLKYISKNEGHLLKLSERVITLLENKQWISKYKGIVQIKNIINNRVHGRLNNLIFNLAKAGHRNRNKPKIDTFNQIRCKKSLSLNHCIRLFQQPNIKEINKKNKTIHYEVEDDKECTFAPKINRSYISYNDKPVNQSFQNQRNEIIHTNYRSNPSSYRDKKNNKRFDNNIRILSNNNSTNQSKSVYEEPYNFYSQQNNHIEKIKEKLFTLRIKRLNEIEEQCTFTPNTNSNYHSKSTLNKSTDYTTRTTKQPRYIKLNDDAKVRKTNLNKLKEKLFLEENENNLHYKGNGKSVSYRNTSRYSQKLYNDANWYFKRKQEELRKQNAEYSYTPELNSNPRYQIKTTFNQRRVKSIEKKKELLLKKEEIEKEQIKELKKAKHGKEKIKEANANIVERLYKKELDKVREQKSKEKENKLQEEKETKAKKKRMKKEFEKLKKEHEFKREQKDREFFNTKTKDKESIHNISSASLDKYIEGKVGNNQEQKTEDIKSGTSRSKEESPSSKSQKRMWEINSLSDLSSNWNSNTKKNKSTTETNDKINTNEINNNINKNTLQEEVIEQLNDKIISNDSPTISTQKEGNTNDRGFHSKSLKAYLDNKK